MQVKELDQLGLKAIMSGTEFSMSYEKEEKRVKFYAFDLVNRLGAVPKEIYSARQVHGDRIAKCPNEEAEDFLYGKIMDQTDALITDQPGLGLLIKFADCTPLVLYDQKKKVLGLVHAGWRGTSKQIGPKTLRAMVEDYGTKIEDMTAYIGPSIDPFHYEVGEDVYQAFEDHPSRKEYFIEDQGTYRLKLAQANAIQLMEAGLSQDQILLDPRSTYESKDLHSYRRDKEKSGLNSLLVLMPESK